MFSSYHHQQKLQRDQQVYNYMHQQNFTNQLTINDSYSPLHYQPSPRPIHAFNNLPHSSYIYHNRNIQQTYQQPMNQIGQGNNMPQVSVENAFYAHQANLKRIRNMGHAHRPGANTNNSVQDQIAPKNPGKLYQTGEIKWAEKNSKLAITGKNNFLRLNPVEIINYKFILNLKVTFLSDVPTGQF